MFALYLQDSAAFGFADSLLGLRGESVRRVLFAATPGKRDGVRTLQRPARSLFRLCVAWIKLQPGRREPQRTHVAGNLNVHIKAQRNLW
ncbi:MAG: hypothetical protein CBARDMAM_1454 [uncultured Caballeronia sp.]|nr:MAG: hypothetical protein CBARDMAM_1454 [uncultured Caballeronia sp.]